MSIFKVFIKKIEHFTGKKLMNWRRMEYVEEGLISQLPATSDVL